MALDDFIPRAWIEEDSLDDFVPEGLESKKKKHPEEEDLDSFVPEGMEEPSAPVAQEQQNILAEALPQIKLEDVISESYNVPKPPDEGGKTREPTQEGYGLLQERYRLLEDLLRSPLGGSQRTSTEIAAEELESKRQEEINERYGKHWYKPMTWLAPESSDLLRRYKLGDEDAIATVDRMRKESRRELGEDIGEATGFLGSIPLGFRAAKKAALKSLGLGELSELGMGEEEKEYLEAADPHGITGMALTAPLYLVGGGAVNAPLQGIRAIRAAQKLQGFKGLIGRGATAAPGYGAVGGGLGLLRPGATPEEAAQEAGISALGGAVGTQAAELGTRGMANVVTSVGRRLQATGSVTGSEYIKRATEILKDFGGKIAKQGAPYAHDAIENAINTAAFLAPELTQGQLSPEDFIAQVGVGTIVGTVTSTPFIPETARPPHYRTPFGEGPPAPPSKKQVAQQRKAQEERKILEEEKQRKVPMRKRTEELLHPGPSIFGREKTTGPRRDLGGEPIEAPLGEPPPGDLEGQAKAIEEEPAKVGRAKTWDQVVSNVGRMNKKDAFALAKKMGIDTEGVKTKAQLVKRMRVRQAEETKTAGPSKREKVLGFAKKFRRVTDPEEGWNQAIENIGGLKRSEAIEVLKDLGIDTEGVKTIKMAQERMKRHRAEAQRDTDFLTGVESAASIRKTTARADQDPTMSVMVSDMTSLSPLNDLVTPVEGDQALVSGARRHEEVAEEQGVGIRHRGTGDVAVGREGGDEFTSVGKTEDVAKLYEPFKDPLGEKNFLSAYEVGGKRIETRLLAGFGKTRAEAVENLNKAKAEWKLASTKKGLYQHKKSPLIDSKKVLASVRPHLKDKESKRVMARAMQRFARLTQEGKHQEAEAALKTAARNVLAGAGVKAPEKKVVNIFKKSFFSEEGPGAPVKREAEAAPKKEPSALERFIKDEGGHQAIDAAQFVAKAALKGIYTGVSKTVEVLTTPVGRFIRFAARNTAGRWINRVLPRSLTEKVLDDETQNAFIRDHLRLELGRNPLIPDPETGAAFFHMLNAQKDALAGNRGEGDLGTIAAMLRHSSQILPEHVTGIRKTAEDNTAKFGRMHTELFYGEDNGSWWKLREHYGYDDSRLIRGVKRVLGKYDEAGYMESRKRIFDAIDRPYMEAQKGTAYVDGANPWGEAFTKMSDLTPVERNVAEHMKTVLDRFRARFKELNPTVNTQNWGLNDYISHMWPDDEGGTKGVKEARGGGLIPGKKAASFILQRALNKDGYIRDAEFVVNEYIPAAIYKIEMDYANAKLTDIVAGRLTGVFSNPERIFKAIRTGEIATGKQTVHQFLSDVKVAIGNSRDFEWVKVVSYQRAKRNKPESFIIERANGTHLTIDARNFSRVPANVVDKRAYRIQFPRIKVKYRSWGRDPETGVFFGVLPALRQKGHSRRITALKNWLLDMRPHEMGSAEEFGRSLQLWTYDSFIGRVNPKAAITNEFGHLNTISVVGWKNWKDANDMLFGLGSFKEKGKDVGLTPKRAAVIIRHAMGDSAYHNVMVNALADALERGAAQGRTLKLDPKTGSITGKYGKVSFSLFNLSEFHVRATAAISAFLKAKREFGATDKQARNYAYKVVMETQGVYQKRESPRLFRPHGTRTELTEATPALLSTSKTQSVINAAKRWGLAFRRYSATWTNLAYDHWVSAKIAASNLLGKGYTPLPAPPAGGRFVYPPGSKMFARLSQADQAINKANWSALSSAQKKEFRDYYREAGKAYHRNKVKAEMAKEARTSRAFQGLALTLAANRLVRAMGYSVGLGVLWETPLGTGQFLETLAENGATAALRGLSVAGGFIADLMEIMNQVFDEEETLMGKARVAASFGIPALALVGQRESTKWHKDDDIYSFAKRWGMGAMVGQAADVSLGLVKTMKPGDPGYQAEEPVGVYGFEKLKFPSVGPKKTTTWQKWLSERSIPGEPLERKEYRRLRNEIQKEQDKRYDVRRTLNMIWDEFFSAKKSGNAEEAKKLVERVKTLMSETGVATSKESFSRYKKSQILEAGLPRKIMGSGSTAQKVLNFTKVLETETKMMTLQDAEFIYNQLWQSQTMDQVPYADKVNMVKAYSGFKFRHRKAK